MRTNSESQPAEAGPRTFDDPSVRIDGRLTRFLLRVAGIDMRDLHDSPAEVARYSVYGFAVIVTSTLALFTMPIALSIALGGFRWVMVPVGLIWAAFIFNIDRWIITVIDHRSLNSEDQASAGEWTAYLIRKVGLFLVRLGLAAVIALSISEPLLLVVFSHEVSSEIDTINQTNKQKAESDIDNDAKGVYQAERNTLEQRIAEAQQGKADAQIVADTRRDEVKTALGQLNCETNPVTAHCTPDLLNGTTGQTGCQGQACTTLQDALTQAISQKVGADADLQLATDAVNAAQNNLLIKEGLRAKPKGSKVLTFDEEKARDKQNADQHLPSTKGFSIHEQALSAAANHDATTRTTIWMVRILLLMFELTPILLKTFSPPTVYEKRGRLRAVRAYAATKKVLHAHLEADARVLSKRVGDRAAWELRMLAAADAAHALKTELGSQLQHERLRRDHDIELRQTIADHARRAADIDSTDIGIVDDERGQDRPPGRDQPPGSDEPSGPADPGPNQPGGDTGDAGPPPDDPSQPEVPDEGSPAGGSGQPAGTDPAPVRPTPRPAQQQPLLPVLASPGPTQPDPGELHGGRWRYQRYLPSASEGGMSIAIMVVTDTWNVFPGLSVLKRFRSGRDWQIPAGRRLSKHIAPILDKAPVDDHFYIVTPYYQAGSLRARLAEPEPLALGTAIQYVKETLLGLRDVWDDGSGTPLQLLHLDLKPANLLFDDGGRIQIIDWGLSSFQSEKRHVPTTTFNRGTPWYAPPEQILGGYRGWPARGWRSPAADIRSLGAVFYEMFTGYWPLLHEAVWAGAVKPDGRPLTEGPNGYFKYLNLLAEREPFPILEYARHLTAQQRQVLEPLQQAIATWLKPDRTERTLGQLADPRVALEMLREASTPIADAGLEEMPIGRYAGMLPPPRRKIEIPDALHIEIREDPDGVA